MRLRKSSPGHISLDKCHHHYPDILRYCFRSGNRPFGLQILDKPQVIHNDEKESESEDEDYVLNDDIEDATNYLDVMNSSIEDKEQYDDHSDVDDIQMANINPHFSDDDIINHNVNVSDNIHENTLRSDNHNERRDRWGQLADSSDPARPPPRKKRKIAHNLCDVFMHKVDGQTPTKANLKTLSVKNLRTLHLKPHGQLVGGAKYVLIERIMRHYKKEHDWEEEDIEDDQSVIDEALNHCAAGVDLDSILCCGRPMASLKVRNVHTNRHYVDCSQCKVRITNSRQMVYHCKTCEYSLCEKCAKTAN
eukprot:8479_1